MATITETIPERIATQAQASRDFIGTKWTDADDKADTAFDAALAAIRDIVELGIPAITVPTVTWEDIVVDFSIHVTKPDLPDVEFNFPTTKPTMGELREYPIFEFPLSDFNALNNETIAAIRAKLAAGGTGLGAAVEAAIWDRMRSRNDAKNLAAYEEAMNYFAARGWELPPGALAGRLAMIQSEILRSETDISNDIAVKQAELALDNEKFIYELAYKTCTEYQRNTVEVIAQQNKAVVDVFVAQMDGYKADVTAEAARVDALGKIIVALMDGYKAEAQAEAAVVDAKSREVEARIKLQLGKAEVAMKITDVEVEIAKFTYGMQVEMFKTIAQVSAQLAASALAAVNASVTSSYSANSSEQAGYNENQSYDMTKEIPSLARNHIYNYDMTK